jgi:hypothetical protein
LGFNDLFFSGHGIDIINFPVYDFIINSNAVKGYVKDILRMAEVRFISPINRWGLKSLEIVKGVFW